METTSRNPISFIRSSRIRTIAYWTFTLPLVFENAAGAMWLFSRFIPGINWLHATAVFAEYLRVMLAHLGYPQYFQYILNPWQLACAAALVAPRLPRVKEWAYAGAFFNYSSAFVYIYLQGMGSIPLQLSLRSLQSFLGHFARPIDALQNQQRPPEQGHCLGSHRRSSWY